MLLLATLRFIWIINYVSGYCIIVECGGQVNKPSKHWSKIPIQHYFPVIYFPIIIRHLSPLSSFSDCDNIWDCCTSQNPCGLKSGDCDLNDHCMNDLVCGIANCGEGFPVNADCCTTSGTFISSLTLSGLKSQDSSHGLDITPSWNKSFGFKLLWLPDEQKPKINKLWNLLNSGLWLLPDIVNL